MTRPPTYHLDVRSTRGTMETDFEFSPTMFKRARELSLMVQQMNGDVGEVPKDVYLLVRVYGFDVLGAARDRPANWKGKEKETEAETGAKMVFLLDPWEAFHKHRLAFKLKGTMIGSIV